MPGSVITTGSLPKFLWPGLKSIHGVTYTQHAKVYSRIFKTVSSNKAWEEYQGVTGFGLASEKPQGQSMAFDSQQQGFTTRVFNVTYALGFIVTMEEIMDNQYEAISKSRTRANAMSMLQTKEQNAHLILNRAFNSTYKGGDGLSLCNTAHVGVAGLSYANQSNPDADLSEAALEDAMIGIRGFQDDKGLYVDVKVKALVIPRQLLFTATRILKSPYQPGNPNNDVNALNYLGAIPSVVESIYLTSPGAWFLTTDTGTTGEGLFYQERMGEMFVEDNDFDTRNFKAGTIERYAFGWDNPRCIWGSNGP